MSGARTILTPEHVEVRLAPAGRGRRFVALLVDAGSSVALAAVVTLPFQALRPPGVVQALFLTASCVTGWGWHVFFEAYRQGRTPGKQLLGLRVVRADAAPLTPRQAFFRAFLCAVFYPGILWIPLDRRSRSLQDIALKTVVVYDWIPESARPRRFPKPDPRPAVPAPSPSSGQPRP